ncbi:MAG: FoF1 ATP synthase subunit a [Eubacteriales bacterium]|nr:FoF1 ATP synthase subunit a [Eubacteriales bacterium]
MQEIIEFLRALGRNLWEQARIGGRSISDGITETLDYGGRVHIHIGNISIPISDASIALCFTTLIILIIALVLRTALKLSGINRRQTILEAAYQGLVNLGKSFGLDQRQAATMAPIIASIFSLITVSNLLSLAKLKPAAQNPAFPISLALFTVCLCIFMGIRFVGISGFMRSLMHPMPALMPFQVLDYLIKPISLAFRLFGNIFGAFILIEFLGLVLPLIVPTVFGLWFDLADGILQGLIFAILSLNYVGEIVEKSSEMEELAAEKRMAKAEKNFAIKSDQASS